MVNGDGNTVLPGATGPAARHRITVRGVSLYVETAGEGFPLLCLHGFTGSVQVWHPFLADFARLFRVVLVDVLGHGRSDAPTDPDRYTMEETVADLLDVMNQLGCPEFACLGYSMGGRIALSIACTAPERVRALVLESASPGLASETERAARRAADEALAKRIEREGVEAFVRVWEALPLFESQKRLPAHVLERQRAIRLAQRPEGLAGSLRGLGTGRQPSWWETLDKLRMPILLVTGEDDEKFNRVADEMRGRLSQAVHCRIPGAGHTVHLEQPQAYTQAVLEFLRTAVSSAPGAAKD